MHRTESRDPIYPLRNSQVSLPVASDATGREAFFKSSKRKDRVSDPISVTGSLRLLGVLADDDKYVILDQLANLIKCQDYGDTAVVTEDCYFNIILAAEAINLLD